MAAVRPTIAPSIATAAAAARASGYGRPVGAPIVIGAPRPSVNVPAPGRIVLTNPAKRKAEDEPAGRPSVVPPAGPATFKGDPIGNQFSEVTVVVKGLPPQATEGDLRRFFAREKISVGKATIAYSKDTWKCKGYGFADLENMKQARYAVATLDGVEVGGCKISCTVMGLPHEPEGAEETAAGAGGGGEVAEGGVVGGGAAEWNGAGAAGAAGAEWAGGPGDWSGYGPGAAAAAAAGYGPGAAAAAAAGYGAGAGYGAAGYGPGYGVEGYGAEGYGEGYGVGAAGMGAWTAEMAAWKGAGKGYGW